MVGNNNDGEKPKSRGGNRWESSSLIPSPWDRLPEIYHTRIRTYIYGYILECTQEKSNRETVGAGSTNLNSAMGSAGLFPLHPHTPTL